MCVSVAVSGFEVDLFLRLLLKGLVRPIYLRVYFYSDIFVI